MINPSVLFTDDEKSAWACTNNNYSPNVAENWMMLFVFYKIYITHVQNSCISHTETHTHTQ